MDTATRAIRRQAKRWVRETNGAPFADRNWAEESFSRVRVTDMTFTEYLARLTRAVDEENSGTRALKRMLSF